MENLLIIDDEKSLLDLLTVVFKKEGYGVKAAISAIKALEILEKERRRPGHYRHQDAPDKAAWTS